MYDIILENQHTVSEIRALIFKFAAKNFAITSYKQLKNLAQLESLF